MELIGKIVLINEKNQVSDKFAKREVIIQTGDTYPQKILVEFTQDKCELLNSYIEGENVKILFNLRGREWTSPTGEVRYFNTVQGWKIENNSTEDYDPTKYKSVNKGNVKNGIAPEIAQDQDEELPF